MGTGQGAIVNQDGSRNTSANPAARGSIVSLFGTGEGQLAPPFTYLDGSLTISAPYPIPEQPVSVTIGGQPAEKFYAGAAPFLPIGILQINVRVPMTVQPGNLPIVVTIGDAFTTKQVTVAVQ